MSVHFCKFEISFAQPDLGNAGSPTHRPSAPAIKFQMVPQIDKVSIANFSALIGCLIFSRGKPKGGTTRFGLVEILTDFNRCDFSHNFRA